MSGRYQVKFEARLSAATSMNNYEYLDLLDRGWRDSGLAQPSGGTVCDVGCASFWYAPTMQTFFRPDRLIGVEVEGHRLFRNGRTRIDYARGYVADEPHAEFVIADYVSYRQPAAVITAWFPFLTPGAILAWRLPLRLLRPQELLNQVGHNLVSDGIFFMINQGREEAELATQLCIAAGLDRVAQWSKPGVLSRHRHVAPELSWWRKGTSVKYSY